MSVNYLVEKEKNKKTLTMKTSRTFNQITAKTWIPIHVSLQSCKKILSCNSSFALTETLREQRMQFLLSVLPDILCTLKRTDKKKLRINSPGRVHYYLAGQILDSTTLPVVHLTNSREKILLASCQCSKSSSSALTCLPAWFKGHPDGRAKSQTEIVLILSSVGIQAIMSQQIKVW